MENRRGEGVLWKIGGGKVKGGEEEGRMEGW